MTDAVTGPVTDPVRVVAFSVFPGAYDRVAAWADRQGHEIVLVVSTPDPGDGRYGTGNASLPDLIGDRVPVLVTRRFGPAVLAALRAVEPDLVVSATFPARIPEAVVALSRHGAVNMHPAPLPRGRGPVPQRLLYEGDTTVGATLHRIAPGFDAGAILAQAVESLEDVSPTGLLTAWGRCIEQVLDDGCARALAGEWGEEQDEAAATYTTAFTAAERRLDWTEPGRLLECRVAGLNAMAPRAVAALDGDSWGVVGLHVLPDRSGSGTPGTVVDRVGDVAVVVCGDGAVQVELARPPDAAGAADGAAGGVR